MKKVILITGASSGMGKESAKKLIQQGHTVYTLARRMEQMTDLQAMGGHPMQVDVTNEKDLENAVNSIIEKDGKIDVLWNNAGYGLFGAIEDVSLDEARRQFEVNLFGMASLTQKVLPHMRKRKSGTIINTSSMGGKMYTPLGAWYHATKHAVEGWSDCLRLETREFDINVVILEPGMIKTEFGDVLYQPMLDHSGKGAYAKLANQIANATKASYDKPDAASPASVIAETISKIVATQKPKTRYRVGKWAKPMVWMRNYLGDKMFDGIIMSQVK